MEKTYRHLDEPLESWLCPHDREEQIPEDINPGLLRYCTTHRDGKGEIITVDLRVAMAISSQSELDAALTLVRRALDGICLHHTIEDITINTETAEAPV